MSNGQNHSTYVLKYAKGEEVKYISHLDFIRTFHRAVRRSELPMAFSQGFNPHPIMTVALPLSVGVTSEGEYLKLGLVGDWSTDEVKSRLNHALPKGLKILEVARTEGKEMDFAKINRAVYRVEVEVEHEMAVPLDAFLQRKELIVPKKTKSGIKDSDIRPHIFALKQDQRDGNVLTLSMCLSAGSAYNLKPDTVLDAMEQYIDGFHVSFFMVHRISLLAGEIQYL